MDASEGMCVNKCVETALSILVILVTFIAVPEDDLIGVYRNNHRQASAVQSSNDGRLLGGDSGQIVDA